MQKKYTFAFLLPALFLGACHSGTQQQTNTEPNETLTAQVAPVFSADSAFAFTQAQVDFGPRIPSTDAHARCATYLQNKLTAFGGQVFVQSAPVKTYDGKQHQLKNIIAAFYPEKKQRVLITAHWDARPFSDQDPDPANHKKPFDAANDGASGVAVILEMARQIQQKAPEVGVDFILWDIEDYGAANDTTPHESTWCIGSQYWAKNQPVKGYKPLYAINLDMVGGANAQFAMDALSRQYAPQLVQKVWSLADELGYSSYFINQNSGQIIDDHYWINQAGIPAIDIVHYTGDDGYGQFYMNWHTQFDNMANIDRNALKATGQVLLELIYREKSSV